MLLPLQGQSLLALADGTCYEAVSIGAAGRAVGEVVFNTAMTGYQEILTDPSYCRQIVTLTCPHIGNTGVNAQDMESARIQASGLVVRDLPRLASSFRSERSLAQFLRDEGTVAIAEVDTRALTRRLRSSGAQSGCIVALEPGQAMTPALRDEAIALARGAPDMTGLDLARVVSTPRRYSWDEAQWELLARDGKPGFAAPPAARFHVVAYDFGVKFNILRLLAQRGCRVTVVPAQTSAGEALALAPDGVFLGNGPGDPSACDYAIAAVGELVARGVPIFGICLGHQILALASGARTFKMKFGHHGANHPVKELATGRVSITSQNHGFAVDDAGLPPTLVATHVSLFDGTLQGLARTDRPAIGFQGHPEASPGPHDIAYLFDRFVAMMEGR